MNDDWNAGYSGGGTPSGGGMNDYTAGANARRLYEDSRQAMEDASRPVSIPDAPAGAPPVAPSFGSWGGSAGTYSGGSTSSGSGAGLHPSAGGLLLLLALGAVLWMNTSVALAEILVVGALIGAVVGTVVLWPVVRLLASGGKWSISQIFQASLLSMCAYAATIYVLTHFGGRVLNPLDHQVQVWLMRNAGMGAQARIVSFLLLTQVPCVLVCGATLRWRLQGPFLSTGGYLKACAVSLATLLVLGLGANAFVRHAFDNAAFTRSSADQSTHLR
jgi:hypothetical protein